MAAAFETNDPAYVDHALGVVARASFSAPPDTGERRVCRAGFQSG
jgi:hypothetical protein